MRWASLVQTIGRRLLLLIGSVSLAVAVEVHLVIDDPAIPAVTFGYYGTTPESPDGRYVVTTRFRQWPDDRRTRVAGALWLCERDFTDHRPLAVIEAVAPHNGAAAHWIDERRIAFADGERIRVIDRDSGADLLPPLRADIGHHSHADRLPCTVRVPGGEPPAGLLVWDLSDGTVAQPVSHDQVVQALAAAGVQADTPPERWRYEHAQWSTDGSHLAFKLWTGKRERFKFLLTCAADGSDLQVFGRKPMHFLWYDGDSLCGHDHQVDDGARDDRSLRRWDRRGRLLDSLAGPGNHLGLDPERRFFASESWYGAPSIDLRLFRTGERDGRRLFRLEDGRLARLVWKQGWHLNPSFSRDGRRIYFHYPVAERRVVAAAIDLP